MAQVNKIQDGTVVFSASDPTAYDLGFNVQGNANITKTLVVAQSNVNDGRIATSTGTDLLLTVNPGAPANVRLESPTGGNILLNNIAWITNTPNLGGFIGASGANALRYYPYVIANVVSDTLTVSDLNTGYPNAVPGQMVVGSTVVYLNVGLGIWRTLGNPSASAYVAKTDLSANTGAASVGTSEGITLQAKLNALSAGSGSGFPNPMTTPGDMIVGASTGTPVRLAKGANETVLTIDTSSGLPTWKALPASVGFANPMTTSGDIIIGGASGTATRLPKGAAETVLTLDTSSGLPTWKALPASGFTNPMTTAGDLIIAGAGGTPTRLPKGTNTQFLRGDGVYATPTSTVASNANAVYLNGIAGPQRTLDVVENRMPDVFFFGAIGTDRNANNPLSTRYGSLAAAQAVYPFVTSLSDQIDWAALQAACNWMADNGRPISLAGAKLNINRPVIMGQNYCRIYGDNAEIGGQYQVASKINGTTTADLSYPTLTNPGPMNGSVFYFPYNVYYAYFDNMSFYDLRFCFANLEGQNSHTYKNIFFGYCNVGVFCYQGSQTPALVNCGSFGLGVAYISSATCYPAGSPYAGGDNYYTDGLKFVNAASGGFGSFGIERQPYFDAWFISSILRPTTPSVTISGSVTYDDADGNTYTDVYTDSKGRPWPQGYFLNPTGRIFFLPFRTPRIAFTVTLVGLDSRGTVEYGNGLINTEIYALEVRDVNYEGMFNYTGIVDKRPTIMTVGSVHAGSVSRQSQIDYIEGEHRLFSYTGRGIVYGTTNGVSINHNGTSPIMLKLTGGADDIIDTGAITDFHSILKKRIPAAENSQNRTQGYADQSAPAAFRIDPDQASILTNNDTGKMTFYTIPRVFHLPYRTADNVLRGSAVLTFGFHFTGYLHVEVINNTTGDMDYGIYKVSTDETEVLTLSNTLSNGDTQAVFTSAPSQGVNIPRFSYYFPVQSDGVTPITGGNAGKGFRVETYTGSNTLKLVNMMTGLSSPYASGTKFRRVQVLAAVRAFSTSMVLLTQALTPNALPYQATNEIGIRNGAGAANPTAAMLLDNLTVTVWFSHYATLTA